MATIPVDYLSELLAEALRTWGGGGLRLFGGGLFVPFFTSTLPFVRAEMCHKKILDKKSAGAVRVRV